MQLGLMKLTYEQVIKCMENIFELMEIEHQGIAVESRHNYEAIMVEVN
jgi:uncharacterized protein YoaH (UPF0181 family)